jgi:cell division protein FtsB
VRKREKEKRSRLRKVFYPAMVMAVAGVCAYILVPGFRELESVRSRVAELERVLLSSKSRNEALRREIASMDTPEGIERAARRHLRLAKPDEVIVRFESPEKAETAER